MRDGASEAGGREGVQRPGKGEVTRVTREVVRDLEVCERQLVTRAQGVAAQEF